jgi:Uncharacterized conserved protein, contains double-stranded beta-helix domain
MKNFYFDSDIEKVNAGEGVTRKVLAHGPELMVCRLHFEKGAIGALHHHPHTQISFILSGAFEFEVDGVKKVVRAGDTLYKQSEVIHGAVCLEEGELLDIFTPEREDFLK